MTTYAAINRRFVEQSLRAAVSWFGVLQERWGRLTLAQIRDLSRLLADRADLLYRLADRVERGAAAPRLPKKHGLRQLAARVARLGRADDPVTRAVLTKLAELTGTSEQPRTTPKALRGLAIEVLALSEDVATSRVLPRDQPAPPSRGRRPNASLAWLLDRGTKLGVADVEIARALAREGIEPLSPSFGLVEPISDEDDAVDAQALTREIVAREAERTAVHDQILATGRGTARRGVKTSGPGRPARTTAQTVEVVRDTVRVLREAGEPLPRREVAVRLGVKPWVAGYRLDKAVELRFAEKLSGGRYQVTSVVPEF